METLEFILPFVNSVEISIDNHLIGYVEIWDDMYEEYERKSYSIPLPEGNWRILGEHRHKIIIGNFK